VAKTCTKCGQEKPEADYHARAGRRDGRKSACKGCANAADRARYAGQVPPVELAPPEVLASMRPWATSLEAAALDALASSSGDLAAAATSLQMTEGGLRARLRELERRSAARGWSPHQEVTQTIPEGFRVKGVSGYYQVQEDGSKKLTGQWVKTQRDDDARIEVLLEALHGLAEPFRGLADPAPPAPGDFADDVMCVYPLGDPHVGMLAWAAETGENFDLEIAERDLVTAVDKLVELAPPSREGVLMNLGDYIHADNYEGTTTKGTKVDTDGRWPKVVRVGIRIMRRMVEKMLTKHDRVRVICEIGNHDRQTALLVAIALEGYYEREPRVFVDTSPSPYHWIRFGKSLIGVTHGDGARGDALPMVMAADRPADWGETRHRYWYCGHIHHDTLKEHRGAVIVESFRTLAARDNWHHGQGYRSGRDLKCDVFHREHGRETRHVVGISRVRAIQGAAK
jgi:hypothetical protein